MTAGNVLSLVVCWLVQAYLVWRAWPAIRRDLARVPRPRLTRRARRGGGLL